jgi:hypothetical protein
MFQRALRAGLALVLVGALASFSLAILSTARSQSTQEIAIGPDAADALARMGKTLSANQFSFGSRTFRAFAGPNGELLHIVHTTRGPMGGGVAAGPAGNVAIRGGLRAMSQLVVAAHIQTFKAVPILITAGVLSRQVLR